jgi:radical SAM family RiPP maturation amino acid epimerase
MFPRLKLIPGKYPPFIHEISDDDLLQICHAKRFIERYAADGMFRQKLLVDPRATAAEYGLKIDPEEIRPLWDAEAARRSAEQGLAPSPVIDLCLRYDRAMVGWMMRRRTSQAIAHPGYRAWWERQIARNDGEIGLPFNIKDVHAPVCFELSKGCTVGCWFCAISAERFDGAFEYNAENAQLWRETLEVVRDIVGPALEVGFCYWATDPFDNPNYEKFIKDFHAIVGNLPATTTAMPHKDVHRTRALLRMSEEYGFVYNRFSILTPKILDRIHLEFTAEELAWTGLELLTKESTIKKAAAGRALEKIKNLTVRGEDTREVEADLAQGTIACVTGFLFNMVEKKVKLISPCRADDRWPKGYRVYDEGTFASARELRELMERMIVDHMPLSFRATDLVRFRRDLRYKEIPDGFELSTPFQLQSITHSSYGRRLGELIHAGNHTGRELVKIFEGSGIPDNEIQVSIDTLFKNGLLDDEPKWNVGAIVEFRTAPLSS